MEKRAPLEIYSDRSTRRRARRRRTLVGTIAVVVAASVLVGAAYAASRFLPEMRGLNTATGSADATTAAVSATSTSVPATTVVAAASQVATEPSRLATITIAAVGDMIFDRRVKELIRAEGGEAPLSAVAKRLSEADVAIGNLESMIGETGEKNADKDVTFRGHPAAIEGLRLAGFDFLSIANNHTMDYGPKPVAETISSLDAETIGHAGAGPNLAKAWEPASVEREGAKVAYLAYTHILPAGFLAATDRWGVASGKMDMSLINEAVKKAKKSHDYVIVSFHWGVEYEDYANGDQVKKAHQVVDAGADMVLAHHPHVIQGIEYYKNGLIAYSLGDFVFDHYSRKTGESFVLEAELGPDGVTSAVAVPVYLDSYGKPEYVKGKEAEVILERLAAISEPHGTTVRVINDTGRIVP